MRQIFLLLTFALFSCNSENNNLNGFWVGGLPNLNGQLYTYEILDSSIIINRYSIVGFEEHKRYNKNNLSLPLGYRSIDFTNEYKLVGDTLILIDTANSEYSIKLIRSNPESLGQRKFFTSLMINLELDSLKFGIPYDSLKKSTALSHLNIGFINDYYSDQYQQDSALIQVYDIIINPDDIHRWIKMELEKSSIANKKFGIAINSDKNIQKNTKENLFKVVQTYNDSVDIYLGGIDPISKKLVYRKFENAP